MPLTKDQLDGINSLTREDSPEKIITTVYDPVRIIIQDAAKKYGSLPSTSQIESFEDQLLQEFITGKVFDKYNKNNKLRTGETPKLIHIVRPIASSIVYDGLFRKKEPKVVDTSESDKFTMAPESYLEEDYNHVVRVQKAVSAWLVRIGAEYEKRILEHKVEDTSKISFILNEMNRTKEWAFDLSYMIENEEVNAGKRLHHEHLRQKNPQIQNIVELYEMEKQRHLSRYTAGVISMRAMVRKFHIMGRSKKMLLKDPDCIPSYAYDDVKYSFCHYDEIPLEDAMQQLEPHFKKLQVPDIDGAYREMVRDIADLKIGVRYKIRKESGFVFMEKQTLNDMIHILQTKDNINSIGDLKSQLFEQETKEKVVEVVLKRAKKEKETAKRAERTGKDPESGLMLGTMKYLAYSSWKNGKTHQEALSEIQKPQEQGGFGSSAGKISTVISWYRTFESNNK